MNTSVLYVITIVLIIVLIYFMTRRLRIDTLAFDSINGHPNVVKNLSIKPGLSILKPEDVSSVDVNGEINGGIRVAGVNVTISTSTDTILSNVANVIIMSEFSGNEGDSLAVYSTSDTDMSIFDKTKDYVVTGYVKRLSTNENDKGVVKYTWGDPNGVGFDPIIGVTDFDNMSFSGVSTDYLVSNEWYLMVGVVRRVGSTITKVSSGTGIHRLSTRKNITYPFTQDYIMKEDNMNIMGLTGMLTNIQEYGTGNRNGTTNTKVSFTKPFIFEVENATDSIVNGIVETMLGGKK
jgi:hypothetical protein